MNSKLVPFTELLSVIVDNRGRTCPVGNTGVPLIATNCVSNESLYPSYETTRFVDENTYNNWFRGHPKPGDILFVCKGSPGRTNLVPSPVDFCIAQDMVAVRANAEKVDPKYLFAVLRSSTVQRQIDNMHVGTLIPHFKKGDFDKLLIPLIGECEQTQIGEIYFELSQKIDLNRRTNQTIEAIAQAIFKSWFVDFAPIKAKIAAKQERRDPLRAAMCAISGKAEAELDTLPPEQYKQLAAAAALFPDEMEPSTFGMVPKGWVHQPLVQLTDKIGSGATPRGGKEVYVAEGVALIRSQNVYDSLFVWDGLARVTDEAAAQLKSVTIQENDVLLNITGASILRTCVVPPDVLPARVNQHVAIIRAKAGIPPRFIHMHLLRADIKSHLLGLNAGASREAITKAHIESVMLLTPGAELLKAFQVATDALFEQVERFSQQMRVLGELRDTLLPKLLSGELSAESLIKATEAV